MAREKQVDYREELRILTTQVETINQQLAGGVGGGNDPAMKAQLQQIEQKLNYLYDSTKTMDAQITEAVKGYFDQIGTQVTKALNSNLTQLFAKLDEMHRTFAELNTNLHNTPAVQGQDILEMKKSLKMLIDVYKDEVAVFKEQNEFLQQKLTNIEKKMK